LLSIMAVTACADTGDEGFSIRHNLAPDTDACTTTPGGAFLSRGVIELNSPNPYLLTPELESRITATEGQESQRTIALRGARVEVAVESMTVDNQAAAAPTLSTPKFTSLVSGSLEPLGQVSVGFDALTPTILGELAAQAPDGNVRIQVTATIQMFGNLGGGDNEIESVPFVYPITVCNGCVANVLPACPTEASAELRTGNACNVFQDGAVDCCVVNGETVCPAVVVPAPAAN